MTILLIRLLLFTAIMSLILHQRLAPHAGGLNQRICRFFRWVDRVFAPSLKFLSGRVPPLQLGPGLFLESSHMVLIVALLTALIFL
jgi:hypothetical protein